MMATKRAASLPRLASGKRSTIRCSSRSAVRRISVASSFSYMIRPRQDTPAPGQYEGHGGLPLFVVHVLGVESGARGFLLGGPTEGDA